MLTKTIEGAGDGRVRRSDQGLSFYGVVLKAAVGWKLTSMSRRSCAPGILF
ncbi:hypothetical protein MJ559_17135 [Klebsiella pneumoniae]|nr:hypothetical protein MJ559_17135 [Klebsiella pneumoniae]